jgi:hypothetical protein
LNTRRTDTHKQPSTPVADENNKRNIMKEWTLLEAFFNDLASAHY